MSKDIFARWGRDERQNVRMQEATFNGRQLDVGYLNGVLVYDQRDREPVSGKVKLVMEGDEWDELLMWNKNLTYVNANPGYVTAYIRLYGEINGAIEPTIIQLYQWPSSTNIYKGSKVAMNWTTGEVTIPPELARRAGYGVTFEVLYQYEDGKAIGFAGYSARQETFVYGDYYSDYELTYTEGWLHRDIYCQYLIGGELHARLIKHPDYEPTETATDDIEVWVDGEQIFSGKVAIPHDAEQGDVKTKICDLPNGYNNKSVVRFRATLDPTVGNNRFFYRPITILYNVKRTYHIKLK